MFPRAASVGSTSPWSSAVWPATRARARDAILRGHVTVDGVRAEKPALAVPANAAITVDDPAGAYVSRAALKLVAALDHFGYDPAGRIALDIGASTGGFTQVLLARGAARVFAIDVGHGQLHPSLAAEPRVVKREGLNARNLDLRDVDGTPVGAIVADVSFISLKTYCSRLARWRRPMAGGSSWSSRNSRSGRSISARPELSAMQPSRVGRRRIWSPG